jgi:DNA-directed RNA polymerase subunit N (RpoN/RPB10)
MIPPRCFTCGYQLCTIELDFESKKDLICNDPTLLPNDQANKISALITDYKLNYCCNANILSTVDLSNIIFRNH